jgi:tetratricopeptide (TPR) repeat protein
MFEIDTRPIGRIEWVYHLLVVDPERGAAELEDLDRIWSDTARHEDLAALSAVLTELDTSQMLRGKPSVRARLVTARHHAARKDISSLGDVADQLLQAAKATHDARLIADAYSLVGDTAQAHSNLTAAEQAFTPALAISQRPVPRLTAPGTPDHVLLGREAQPEAPGIPPKSWGVHAERGAVAAYSIGIVNVGPGREAVRSAYRKQVERIAPLQLVGREAELGELAAYCTEPGRGPYVWWQAPAWAGKSALMSTFVLHPPTGVRVVAFFVTARLGAQDTREAFTEVVLEQLAELLGQDLPSLTAATRDAHLLGMLEQAAVASAVQGERLILVVDGLDEDRGVTTGQDAYSITGLLPHNPPAGMRVVVAGRPDPPIPDDVPGWHPLRDPGIVRPLTPSAYAQDIKTLAQQELKRLLRGTPAQQDLLGLLTAARGGLSGLDLVSLTGAPLWDIEEVLHGVSGRTFTRRVSTWQPEASPEVYLLGHEELQAIATAYFGAQRLIGYQDRLHAWAEEYRNRGWPTGTPEYLLRGYFQMLTTTGDTTRLAACATDAARHERMLDITGGDAAALNEVTITLDLLAAQDDPDLTGALRLARHRDYLADRNANIPTHLPAVWATLGQHIRAEALARSITDPDRQAQALAAVAEALAEAGQHEQAAAMASGAETVARSVTHPGRRAQALMAVARTLAEAGRPEQAVTLAQSIPDLGRQAQALTAVAEALAEAGRPEQAVTLAQSIPDPGRQAQALTAVAEALGRVGQHEQAAALARSIPDPGRQAYALAAVAEALAEAGQHEQAAAMASGAETVARSIPDPGRRAQALAVVTRALVEAGQYEQAATLARSVTDPDRWAPTLAVVARALVEAGQYEQAATLARSVIDLERRAQALTAVAEALARADQHEQAETVARSIPDPGRQALALAAVAKALAEAGQFEQAVSVARSVTDPGRQAQALTTVARALAEAGQYEQAATVASWAATVLRSITHPERRVPTLTAVARALARAGQYEQAATVARSITDPYRQAYALAAAAGDLARADQPEQAAAMASGAETVARSATDPGRQAQPLAAVAKELAEAGQYEQAAAMASRAETVARSATDPGRQEEALTAVARELAEAGQFEQAETVAASSPIRAGRRRP